MTGSGLLVPAGAVVGLFVDAICVRLSLTIALAVWMTDCASSDGAVFVGCDCKPGKLQAAKSRLAAIQKSTFLVLRIFILVSFLANPIIGLTDG
jgi:hypothetical protein